MSWQDSVIRFWFDELDPDHWFRARPEVDAAIGARFGELHAALN